MTKVRRNITDSKEINEISIINVANDWGVELFEKGKGSYLSYCINPDHNDKNLGSFYIIEKDGKNFFHCFSCGINGGPIDLVMKIDNCSFLEALNKLAQKYDMVKYEYVDPKDIPPRWDGLSYEEYGLFGLGNVTIKKPYGLDEYEKVLCKYERYTLRQMARDNPELHDDMLVGKFAEFMDSVAHLMYLMVTGRIRGPNLHYNSSWEKVIIDLVERQKKLLKKGLIDKTKYHKVVLTREDRINKKIMEAKANGIA